MPQRAVDAAGEDRFQPSAWTEAVGPAAPDVLGRIVVLQCRAARILQANGMRSEAARAEQFAARARLMRDEPMATRRMHASVQALYEAPQNGPRLDLALDGAISLMGAQLGNVQLAAPTTGSLRIAAQRGFGREFLEHFADVGDDTSACGRAASRHSQTLIVDVMNDPGFAPHRHMAIQSRFRAVLSTPMIDAGGRLRGVISTHFERPHRPSSRDLQLMEWYAELAAATLAREPSPPALALQSGSRRAVDRAREERERAQALVARARQQIAVPSPMPGPPSRP